jgi:hypothetical protein
MGAHSPASPTLSRLWVCTLLFSEADTFSLHMCFPLTVLSAFLFLPAGQKLPEPMDWALFSIHAAPVLWGLPGIG